MSMRLIKLARTGNSYAIDREYEVRRQRNEKEALPAESQNSST